MLAEPFPCVFINVIFQDYNMKKFAKLLVAALLLSSAVAQAAPITFIYTGTGSGLIGEEVFADSAFEITQQSDTANLQSCGANCSFINALSTTVTIANVGTFSFAVGTRTYIAGSSLGLARAGASGLDLFNVFQIPGYDLLSSIGPVVDTPSLIQWDLSPILTDGGILEFTGNIGTSTFQALTDAVDVPEPASLAIFGLGLAGLAAARRRKAA